jgi:Bacterial toxin 46
VVLVGVGLVVALLLKKAIVKVREPKMPKLEGGETKLLFGKYDPRTAQRSLPPEKPLPRPVPEHANAPPAKPLPQTRREALIEKYRKPGGLTGDVNTDINIKSRKALARKFYEDAGYSGQRLEGHLKGIDYSKDVALYSLSKGRPVAQWQPPGTPTGGYFSRPGGDPAKMGIDHSGRELLNYTPKERVTVLKSTAADITSWKDATTVYKGGETQYFTGSPDLFDVLK